MPVTVFCGDPVSDRSSGSTGLARLLRHGLQGLAWPEGHLRRTVDPCVWPYAVNTGYYTFSYVKDGESKTLPARYSFTLVKEGEDWMIVDHHSSAMPTTPR